MFDNTKKLPRAILVAVDTGEYDVQTSLAELTELAESAGVEVVAQSVQKRPAPDTATVVGSGRLEELAQSIQTLEADMLLFDCELSGSQTRNIEKAVDAAVVDRTMLILDIFAARARSSEGRLQVELAQLRYRLPRLAGSGSNLSRLGGGIGTRGPGETKLETDRRHIRSRIQKLEKELEELSQRREQMRTRRKKDGVTTAAIVGYTNVGKSTLLGALTDQGILGEDRLFATLDPTSRALLLPDGRSIMLIDTVGLVRRLPHHLVEAFKSTLEEAASADLLLCVCDASSPEMEEQITITTTLLAELGAADTPVITILNKCDLVPGLLPPQRERTVLLSAKERQGFDDLLAAISGALTPTQQRCKLLLPYPQSGLLAEIRQDGKVFSEEYTPDGILADTLVHIKLLHKVEPFLL